MKKVQAYFAGQTVYSNTPEAHQLHNKNRFGEKKTGKIIYSLSEVLFLVEKEKMDVFSNLKKFSKGELLIKFRKIDKKIQLKYIVFRDLRKKGYILKTALKFGADFRAYEKGKKLGKAHAKWIIFVEHETKKTSWHEFSAKNRVAHSTKKKLLLAIVDEEEDITYYEVRWLKP